MPDYRSVSQVGDLKCGWYYYLARVEKLVKRPAAWLPQGTAFHEAAELIETSPHPLTLEEAQTAFSEAYRREIDRYTEEVPNQWDWFPSGPYRGPTDIQRRYEIGLGQVESYMRYREAHPEEELVRLDDGPAVEVAFDVLFGSVRVKGYIDQVIKGRVRDLKTGKKPGNDFQLATYAAAMYLQYKLLIVEGDYWMAQTGKPTKPYDLREWRLQELVDIYGQADETIRAGDFRPNPSKENCQFCTVAWHCDYREE